MAGEGPSTGHPGLPEDHYPYCTTIVAFLYGAPCGLIFAVNPTKTARKGIKEIAPNMLIAGAIAQNKAEVAILRTRYRDMKKAGRESPTLADLFAIFVERSKQNDVIQDYYISPTVFVGFDSTGFQIFTFTNRKPQTAENPNLCFLGPGAEVAKQTYFQYSQNITDKHNAKKIGRHIIRTVARSKDYFSKVVYYAHIAPTKSKIYPAINVLKSAEEFAPAPVVPVDIHDPNESDGNMDDEYL